MLDRLKQLSILNLTLYAARSLLERVVKHSVILVTDDTVKQELALHKQFSYPHVYCSVTDLAVVKDRLNATAVSRYGLNVSDSREKAQIARALVFPARIGLEFHYQSDNVPELLLQMEQLALYSATNKLTANIDHAGLQFNITLEVPESTSFQLATLEQPSTPGASDLTVSLIVHGYIGTTVDVAAMQHPMEVNYEIST